MPCSLGSKTKTPLLLILLQRFFLFFLFGPVTKNNNLFYCTWRSAEDMHCVRLQYTQTTTIPPTGCPRDALGTSLHYAHATPRASRAGRALPGPALLLWRQKMMLGNRFLHSVTIPNPKKEVSPLVSRCQAEEFGPNLLTALISS